MYGYRNMGWRDQIRHWRVCAHACTVTLCKIHVTSLRYSHGESSWLEEDVICNLKSSRCLFLHSLEDKVGRVHPDARLCCLDSSPSCPSDKMPGPLVPTMSTMDEHSRYCGCVASPSRFGVHSDSPFLSGHYTDVEHMFSFHLQHLSPPNMMIKNIFSKTCRDRVPPRRTTVCVQTYELTFPKRFGLRVDYPANSRTVSNAVFADATLVFWVFLISFFSGGRACEKIVFWRKRRLLLYGGRVKNTGPRFLGFIFRRCPPILNVFPIVRVQH